MNQRTDPTRLIALYFTGAVAIMGMFTFSWCAIFKIYIDVPMLLVLQAVTVGGVSSFTMLLTGRTLGQLAQPSDGETTMTQTTQTTIKPKSVPTETNPLPVKVTNPPSDPVPTVET